MYWLIKTDLNEFEIWSDLQYAMMVRKCEYYGAHPSWQKIRELEPTSITEDYAIDQSDTMGNLEMMRREK